ncbi:unnamed protein product [Chrysoparadoxa australica]
MATAAILQSAVLRTTARVRPTPSLFYFPGLSSQEWHDPSHFPWTKLLEDNVENIKQEYLQMQRDGVADDYNTSDNNEDHKLHSGNWAWHSYVRKGERQEHFRERCPQTAAVLDEIGIMTGTPFSYSFFSTLASKSRIAPHSSSCNLRLRSHLPLIVPEGSANECGLRVGVETKKWVEGKCLIFDDCYEHEAWNETESPRVILLLDTWHPEIDEKERKAS